MAQKLLIIILIIFVATNAFAWEFTTPLGIRIRASQATINQYNKHWAVFPDTVFPLRKTPSLDVEVESLGPKWETIDWEIVDQFYSLLYEKHGSPSRADPTKLILSIKPVAYQCWGNHDTTSYDFASYYGCIDGLYASNNRIVIFLGDDPGQLWWGSTAKPFCDTALEHELNHYFLFWKGDPSWRRENGKDFQSVREELCQ